VSRPNDGNVTGLHKEPVEEQSAHLLETRSRIPSCRHAAALSR
jgi:hypothetical protein